MHAGSIYYRSYNFWSLAQTSQFIEGVKISTGSSSQHLEASAAAAAKKPGGATSPMREDVTEPEAKRPATGPSPLREESLLENAGDESKEEDWSNWLSPVQAKLL